MRRIDKVFNSPLIYPGGKRWLFKTLVKLIPPNTIEMVSPFLGGGCVELNCAIRGIAVYGYDICPYLVNFWKHWLVSPSSIERGAKDILATYTHDMLKNVKTNFNFTGYKGAILYYACNRVSFGGLTFDSHVKGYEIIDDNFVYPLSKGHKNRRNVFPFSKLWEKFPTLPMTVDKMDFRESLLEHPDIFAYIDPPYVGTESLYRLDGFDHVDLADILRKRENWVLSYSDKPLMRELYEGHQMIKTTSRNFNTGKKTSTELLILSHDIGEKIDVEFL